MFEVAAVKSVNLTGFCLGLLGFCFLAWWVPI